ncbi:NAD(P)-dependent oxidoreductase [Propylenella binzhouense]|uniref:NAD(P)-dependent oxidoreductase n=1 Tax=Propylenella binzhouense TaxID=2555902 RepID=A0A964WT26_9HYPH|nr:NAD(P)-dependent oxidoreductase [Propylenella binzhouense]MYZ47405.1 NAD(P)-dependent oxidoreductase [Propylenella binzhouense]
MLVERSSAGRGGPASGPVEDRRIEFGELHPPLSAHEAHVEADRCYFCYDAPCTVACPTSIDIPLFIRQIATGNPKGAARTIFAENILGGMCGRVCPVETLCEEACVRMEAEGKPVKIGMLQRHATDHLIFAGEQPFARAAPTGRRVAVVGAGPAGLACAHRLALRGHEVVMFDARPRPGGLNEYGIAAYKTVDDFAQREVDFILSVGGITLEPGMALGRDFTLAELGEDFDAVFLGMGLAGVNALAAPGEAAPGVTDAVEWIARLRQAEDASAVPIAPRVAVIGGGMTAIDAAVQAKLLGAEEVTILYRRGRADMKASLWEQELAQTRGVTILEWAQPVQIIAGQSGAVEAIVVERTRIAGGRLVGTGAVVTIPVDMVFKAIGQTFVPEPLGAAAGIRLEGGRIAVDAERRTSAPGIWAGGDCVAGGQDLTVAAVEDGKVAAESIHRSLTGGAAP